MSIRPKLLLICVTLSCCLGGWGSAPRTTCAQGADEDQYVGSRRCRRCHNQEFRSWEATPMATALDVLAPGQRAEAKRAARLDPDRDYRTDEACLPCHTVGFGHEGGFQVGADAANTRERLAGVGCESCHGPGGRVLGEGQKDATYEANRRARLPALQELGYVPAPDAAVCQRCHNESSPTYRPFEFEGRMREGVHARSER